MRFTVVSSLALISLFSALDVQGEASTDPGTTEIHADSSEIEVTSADSIADLAGRQAGVLIRDGMHARGSRTGEVTYLVDGIEHMDPVTGEYQDDVPLNSLSEVTVVASSFGAAYSGARSSVISTVTREGGSRYSGEISFTGNDWQALGLTDGWSWSHPGPFREAMLEGELGVGGPEPVTSHLLPALGLDIPGEARLYVSGRWLQTGGGEDGRYGYWFNDWVKSWSGTLKLTYRPTPGTEIDLTGTRLDMTTGWQDEYWQWNRFETPYIDLDSLSPSYGDTLAYGENILYGLPTRSRHNWSLGFDLTQVLDERTSLELRFSHFNTDYTHRIRNPADSSTAWLGEGWSIDGWLAFEPERIQEVDGFYTQGPHWNVRRESETSLFTFALGVSRLVGGSHTIRAGLEQRVWSSTYFDVEARSPDSLGITSFHAGPGATALYLQDRIDSGEMTATAGFRFDAFNPNHSAPDTSASVKLGFSPRISPSYRVTDSDLISMHYGRYLQIPSFQHLYGGNDLTLPGSFGPQGNPDLDLEETVSYELGIRHDFWSFASIGVTGYYRDFFGLIDTHRTWDSAGVYHDVFVNADYGHARGLEVTVSKHQRDYWSFDFNYTFAEAKGTSSSDVQNIIYENMGWFQPVDESYLDWDQRHTINAGLDFRIPRGEGPRLGGFPVLEGFGINLQWSYGSGYPFTTSLQDPLQQPVVNTVRYPRSYNTDLRVNRTFWTGPLTVDLSCEVLNLFNRHNIVEIKDVAWYEAESQGGYD